MASKMKWTLGCILLIGLGACFGPKTGSEEVLTNIVTEQEGEEKPEMITIIMRVAKEGENEVKFEVVQTIKSLAFYKGRALMPINNEDDYVARIFDAGQQLLFEQSFLDPLQKTYEYVNEEGHLETVKVNLEEDFFTFRLNYVPTLTELIIYQIQPDGLHSIFKSTLKIESR